MDTTNEELGVTIHLLGTMHSKILGKMKEGKAIIAYLSTHQFTHVFSELAHDISAIDADPGKLTTAIDTLTAGEPDRKANRPGWVHYMQNKDKMGDLVGGQRLDEMYAAIALRGQGSSSGLETNEGLRADASAQNDRDLGPANHGKPDWHDDIQTAIQNGDQKFMWKLIGARMKSGQDNEDTEERNARWIGSRVSAHGALHRGDSQLWIVGASHLPGLVLRLSQAGWTVTTAGLITDPQDGHGSGHQDRVVAGGVEATRTRS
ncbi:MAG: hypothetical protein K8W52_40835 [Deltaproteobacteria bacterium]|nr:hypothetical protein [Deltaproteobacteria bacterium]